MPSVHITTVFLLFLLFSCIRGEQEISLKKYSDHILDNQNYANEDYSFTSEYKLRAWYESQKFVDAYKFEYASGDHQVSAVYLRPKKQSQDISYPVITFIRGGYQSTFGFSLVQLKWLSHFVERGYVVLCSEIRKNDTENEIVHDFFGGEEREDVFNLIEVAKNSEVLGNLNWNEHHSISWGSRGGIMSYRLLHDGLPVRSSIVIQGASNMERLAQERGRHYFNYLSDKEIVKRNVTNFKNIKKPLLIIHDKDNSKTSVDHAKEAYEHIKTYNERAKLMIIEKDFSEKLYDPSFIDELIHFLSEKEVITEKSSF